MLLVIVLVALHPSRRSVLPMLTEETSFYVMLLVCCAFAGWFGFRHGKQYALGAGIAVSLLAGSWFQITLYETRVNVTMATAVILLIVYCFHSWRQIFAHLCAVDYMIGCIVFWHIVVDVYHGGEIAPVAAKAYGQWMLPHAAGRFSFLHSGSFSKLSTVFVVVASFISIANVAESFFNINLWETFFCEVDDLVTRVKSQRFDLFYRGMGPVRNPIFLGIVLFTMFPFAIDLISRGSQGKQGRAVGYLGLVLITLGILATVSRGPVACIFIAAAFGLGWWSRSAKWCIIVLVVIGSVWTATHFEKAIGYLESDGDEHTASFIVNVDDSGESEIYTGTRQRLLIPRVYGPIMFKGGPMGYGSVDSAGFPPKNIPGLPTDPKTLHRIRNIDNAYINVGLAFGWVGVAIFSVLLIVAAYSAIRLAPVAGTYLYPSDWPLLVSIAAVLFALMFQIFTVHLSYDYGFWVSFQIGIVAGLTSRCSRIRRGFTAP